MCVLYHNIIINAINLFSLKNKLIVDVVLQLIYNYLRGEIMKNENFDIWLGIGLNIMYYRKEQGMTQIQLAEKCNISRTYMQKIETAACSCTLDTLIGISKALNIPLKKLFEFRD